MKDIEVKLLSELMKNSRRSDKELARAVGVSQPTISRAIKKLEKEKMLEYTLVPDLRKLGFEILAFTFGNWNRESFPNTRVNEMKEFISKHPEMIFVSTGTGPGCDRMAITVHKSYMDYCKIIDEFKQEWGQYFSSLTTFMVSLESDNILKHLSFSTLANMLQSEPE